MIPPTTAVESAGYRHFHEQLASLKQRLLDMSARAEELIDLAIEGLLEREAEKAETVIEADHQIDDLEVEIESLAVNLLALQQPMASDLRFIIGSIKVSNDLERVGDHAVNIAQETLRLLDTTQVITPNAEIEDLAKRTREMLSDSLDAFIRSDGALGRDVCRRDDQVDAMNESLFRIMLTHMMENPLNISAALQLILVGRNLERVADLATNIGEDAVYLAEGKQIKHHLEERVPR